MTELISIQSALHEVAGQFAPDVVDLPEKLAKLKSIAEQQNDTLQQAKCEQLQYARDVDELQQKINNTQQKLASPVDGADIDQLRLQINEHTVCTYCCC